MHPPDVLDIGDATSRQYPNGKLELRCPGRQCEYHALDSAVSGLHVLSVCDTVSYSFRKGKKSALKRLDIDKSMITCSDKLALPTLGSMRRQTASSYYSMDI